MKKYEPIFFVLLGIVLVGCLFMFSYRLGYATAFSEQQSVIEAMKATHARAITEAIDSAMTKERDLRGAVDEIQAKYQQLEEEATRAREADQRLIDDLKSGNRRLSIAVKSSGACKTNAGSPASSGGGADDERAELDPEAADFLVRLAREGDRNTRERNACVEAYNAVREKMNAP